MKKSVAKGVMAVLFVAASLVLLGCAIANGGNNGGNGSSNNNGGGGNSNGSGGGTGVYKDFHNYPIGKQTADGNLTVTNNVAQEVLLFQSEVKPENYIGTIPRNESIKLTLPAGKFYTIVSVVKSVYEQSQLEARQTSTLVYYSDTQAYKVTVSPENLVGGGTWTFNNSTNYWAVIEATDGSGTTYAVIQPRTGVKVPIQTNKSYPYKITYKKELKYDNKIVAIVDSSLKTDNDIARCTDENPYFRTDLTGNNADIAADLAPSILLINNSNKSLEISYGQVKLSNIGESVADYAVVGGDKAMITGLTAGGKLNSINVYSPSFDEAVYCSDETVLTKGKVYVITVESWNDLTATAPVKFTVKEESAAEYYDPDPNQ